MAAIRRLAAEYKSMMAHRSENVYAAPLEENMYEWHFTIRGPHAHKTSASNETETGDSKASASSSPTTATVSSPSPVTADYLHVKEEQGMLGYELGLYHGALLFNTAFPYEPPNIMFFSATGRFECNVKICSTISQFHKEHWQPTYNIPFILESVREFMRTEGELGSGGLFKGSVTREAKKQYALDSWDFKCSQCGCATREVYEEYMRPALLSLLAAGDASTPSVLPTTEAPTPLPLMPASSPVLPPEAPPVETAAARTTTVEEGVHSDREQAPEEEEEEEEVQQVLPPEVASTPAGETESSQQSLPPAVVIPPVAATTAVQSLPRSGQQAGHDAYGAAPHVVGEVERESVFAIVKSFFDIRLLDRMVASLCVTVACILLRWWAVWCWHVLMDF